MDLAALVYEAARGMPKSEQFGMISQVTRAVASVPANIAEGYQRALGRTTLALSGSRADRWLRPRPSFCSPSGSGTCRRTPSIPASPQPTS